MGSTSTNKTMQSLNVIILAAGKSVRMKSATPKILHSLCGRPMIQYNTDLVRSLGSLKTYIVLGHQSDLIKRQLQKNMRVVIQRKLLGTADAVKQTLPLIKGFKGDILVLCADTPLLTKETIGRLIKFHQQTKADCTLLSCAVNDPRGYGRIIRGLNNSILAIREEKDTLEDEKSIKEINTGVYCFRSQILQKAVKAVNLNQKKKEFYLTDVVEFLVHNNAKVETLQTEDATEGLGINTRQDLLRAEKIMRQRILDRLMHQGVAIRDADTVFIDHDVTIGQETTIYPFSIIEGDVLIGRRCKIGPFCHIRSGVRIADETEVGNFTEVSRAKMGKNCFMKHFSFLGDAIVGDRVNIGAGVVTANFDGKDKNTTRIADDAFIGSDSILIAPLSIGEKAVTGAGSVVTRNQTIPKESIVVGVPARMISRRTIK
ncbi:MAG: sugar phosphate nucleotidyltransferase [Candidatus Omnitrophota bacterium]